MSTEEGLGTAPPLVSLSYSTGFGQENQNHSKNFRQKIHVIQKDQGRGAMVRRSGSIGVMETHRADTGSLKPLRGQIWEETWGSWQSLMPVICSSHSGFSQTSYWSCLRIQQGIPLAKAYGFQTCSRCDMQRGYKAVCQTTQHRHSWVSRNLYPLPTLFTSQFQQQHWATA